MIESEQRLRVDIGLKIGLGLDTFADDPFTFLADIRTQSAQLTGPVPERPMGDQTSPESGMGTMICTRRTPPSCRGLRPS